MKIKPSFIVDAKGRKVAVQIPIESYHKLIQAWEELNDIAAYDKAKRNQGKLVPFADVFPAARVKK